MITVTVTKPGRWKALVMVLVRSLLVALCPPSVGRHICMGCMSSGQITEPPSTLYYIMYVPWETELVVISLYITSDLTLTP